MTAARIDAAEEWRPCPALGGYEVSSCGRVRASSGRILAQGHDSDGYPTVTVSLGGDRAKRRTRRVHRLVCRAFHGEPRAPHREAAHLDGVRSNCRADNLKWVGKIQNHSHRKAHGTWPTGEKHPRAKLTWADVDHIRTRYANSRTIAADYGISRHTVFDIWQNVRWTKAGNAAQEPLHQSSIKGRV